MISYKCSQCENDFETTKILLNKVKYCSDECKIEAGVLVERACEVCNTLYRKRPVAKSAVCSRECYHKHLKGKRPLSFNDGQLTSNTPAAINKRRKTCIDKGLWVDPNLKFEDMTYAIYRHLVNQCTIRKRKKVFADWDGYDFYDKEYIRDYLTLDYRDKKYPTVDHKISVFNGFKNKISVEEISSVTNLVITKRHINSSKQSKNYDQV